MPVTTTPPAITEPAPERPLMDEMVKRALADHPLEEHSATAGSIQKPGNPNTESKVIYGLGKGADVASTIYNMSKGGHEHNPLTNWAGDKAALPISIAGELGIYLLAKKFLGENHPNIMNAIVAGGGLSHGAAAVNNMLHTPPDQPAPITNDIHPTHFAKPR